MRLLFLQAVRRRMDRLGLTVLRGTAGLDADGRASLALDDIEEAWRRHLAGEQLPTPTQRRLH